MNQHSFEAGFIKASLDNGLTETEALTLLLKAANFTPEQYSQVLGDGKFNAIEYGSMGALAGAGLGLASGYDSDPKKRHMLKNMGIGALSGGAAGALGGGLYGLDQKFDEIKGQRIAKMEAANTLASRLEQMVWGLGFGQNRRDITAENQRSLLDEVGPFASSH